jgi:hypothetical protein
MSCPLLAGGRPLPTLDVKPPDRPSSKSRDPPREEEREKKKKKHKKRSRTRSRSPKYHSSSKSRSRSHSKAKHSLPSAYRTVRRSRWVCGAPTPSWSCVCCVHKTPFTWHLMGWGRRLEMSTALTRQICGKRGSLQIQMRLFTAHHLLPSCKK